MFWSITSHHALFVPPRGFNSEVLLYPSSLNVSRFSTPCPEYMLLLLVIILHHHDHVVYLSEKGELSESLRLCSRMLALILLHICDLDVLIGLRWNGME